MTLPSYGLVLVRATNRSSTKAGGMTPRSGYRVERDLAYGSGPRQRLDLYLPEAAAEDAPLLVFFYGGRWQSGSKSLYPFVGQAFASRGYPVAVPDYRLYPEVRYDGILADAAAALRWLARHPDVTGTAGPARRPMVLMGHSAGAWIAAMLALDRDRSGAGCPVPAAAIGLAGPYDFLPLEDEDLREIFGPGEATPVSQPISHVDPGDPPMLLLTGAADTTVKPGNTERLAARLKAAGVPVETRFYPRIGHVALVGALAAPLRFLAPVRDDIDDFLRRVAGSGERC